MNPLTYPKQIILPVLVTIVFACFALLPVAQAVVPPPDGGYANFTTAEGQNALLHLSSGAGNTAVGWFSLESVSTGSFNTGVGAGTLVLNTADRNTATGAGALLSNSTGVDNTANGAFALLSNTEGNSNTALGAGALFSNIGDDNTANGVDALHNNASGFLNTAMGSEALLNNTAGHGNTAVGAGALINSTSSFNIALGEGAGSGVTIAQNVICIGAPGADVKNGFFTRNIRNVTTQHADAIPVVVDSAGQLGTMSSSKRFKKEIRPMDKASEAVLALKPVAFHYKKDKRNTPQFGLIAEEVAQVNPDLVVRDKNGEIYTVRYDAVNAMLLNEFLKEHRAFVKEQRKVEKLEKQVAALTAGLQKVSAQIALRKSAPQTVVDNR